MMPTFGETASCCKIANLLAAVILIVAIVNISTAEAGRRRGRNRARSISSADNSASHDGGVQTLAKQKRRYASSLDMKNYPFKIAPSHNRRQEADTRTEVVNVFSTLTDLTQMFKPSEGGDNLVSSVNSLPPGETVRLRRLYCKVGIGYHLEINRDGKVVARHKATPDGIMDMRSVERGVVSIRSARHQRRYLCMKKNGHLITRKKFRPDCAFRENIEGNNFNTYASERYSDHERRKGYYLSITKNGKIPTRRGKKLSWRQNRTHWLPRLLSKGESQKYKNILEIR